MQPAPTGLAPVGSPPPSPDERRAGPLRRAATGLAMIAVDSAAWYLWLGQDLWYVGAPIVLTSGGAIYAVQGRYQHALVSMSLRALLPVGILLVAERSSLTPKGQRQVLSVSLGIANVMDIALAFYDQLIQDEPKAKTKANAMTIQPTSGGALLGYGRAF